MNRRMVQQGHSLPGLLAGLAGLALLAGLPAGVLLPAARGKAVEGAARNLAGRMHNLAARAGVEGRSHGLVFSLGQVPEPMREGEDGDGDGLRRADLTTGRDPQSLPFRLSRDFPGVRIGIPDWPDLIDLPPGKIPLGPEDSPIRFGAARMAVFDPEGHATSGSLFLTDGRNSIWALVVNGSTARIQLWRFDRTQGCWRRV